MTEMTDPFVAGSPVSDPFAAATNVVNATEGYITMDDLEGRLILIHAKSSGTRPSKRPNEPDYTYLVSDIVVLDGPPTDKIPALPYREEDNQTLFGKALLGQIRGVGTGKIYLGRIGKGEKRAGNNAPWLLKEPTPADVQLKDRYIMKLREAAPATPAAPQTDAPW